MHPDLIPPAPSIKIPAMIWHDGKKYFSVVRYAAKYQISPQGVRKYAERHPERVREHNGHTYLIERSRIQT
jgi:hypothetical protein